jgi:hypothetical protein
MTKAGTVPAEKRTSLTIRTTSHHQDSVRHNDGETSNPDPPPDGGYGWTIVVAILFLNAVTWGRPMALWIRPTSTDVRQDSTRRSESTCLTLRRMLLSLGVLHLCTRLSGVSLSLLLCYVHP